MIARGERRPTHALILAAVRRIPRGRVATYGLIARLAGLPRQPRLVGYALRHADDTVPWHRVINVKGMISPRAASDSLPLQRMLLETEGVRFDSAGRIDLRRYLWKTRREANRSSKGRPRSTPTSSART